MTSKNKDLKTPFRIFTFISFPGLLLSLLLVLLDKSKNLGAVALLPAIPFIYVSYITTPIALVLGMIYMWHINNRKLKMQIGALLLGMAALLVWGFFG